MANISERANIKLMATLVFAFKGLLQYGRIDFSLLKHQ